MVHEEDVRRVQSELPEEELLFELSDFFKVCGDTTRIKILESLRRAELCVCDLAAILKASQSAVSHQLKILRLSNLVKSRKAGKAVYYRLSDFHVSDILERGLDHVKEGIR
jgi:ArsR family transcriptional regulator